MLKKKKVFLVCCLGITTFTDDEYCNFIYSTCD